MLDSMSLKRLLAQDNASSLHRDRPSLPDPLNSMESGHPEISPRILTPDNLPHITAYTQYLDPASAGSTPIYIFPGGHSLFQFYVFVFFTFS